jgi:hypothetical protein
MNAEALHIHSMGWRKVKNVGVPVVVGIGLTDLTKIGGVSSTLDTPGSTIPDSRYMQVL